MHEVTALLARARDAVIACHIHPDADTLGSGLALAAFLRSRGTRVSVSFAEPSALPEVFATLPGSGDIMRPSDVPAAVDTFISVDAASSDRLGELAGYVGTAAHSIVIDHHRSNAGFGDVNYIDATADSTTVLVARILRQFGEAPFPRDIAHCLYAGLVTDTGSFRWCGPEAHVLAAELIGCGIDAVAISRDLLDTHPFGRLGMLSTVLGGARLLPEVAGGQGLVLATVHEADLLGLPEDERETVIDIVRGTAEAEVAAVLKETGPARWAVSLRSKQCVDVARVAAAFGGGGHARSAGFNATGDQEAVIADLVRELG
ncbi:DHH family phosphoesterase [Hoyosella sp. G463]|uniref:DHH family phosphoesterase n=1 Tax=Lolliginicoccus lacisalsi TaxID=2742202 RepID=A0A927JAA8_9ACTN|nr:DHH family phosphoesterase [Lolliginicoccus lacisalsi]MBD8505453.1 DHH family phosphoesterase [Lolliginicoccus lacisalsi]